MNVGNVTGRSTFFHNVAAEKLQKTVKQPGGTASGARTRDRVELRYDDVLKAEKEGYIEINGERFAVTGEMASDMRQAYEELRARSEAKAARLTAAQNARLAKQQAESARMDGKSMQRAAEIARHISEGGRVPSEDEYFLMTFSKEMYQSAKMMAATAEEQKECESVFEDGELVVMEAEKIAARIDKDLENEPSIMAGAED